MKIVANFFTAMLLVLVFVAFTFAGEKPEVTYKVNGTIQAWASYAQTGADTNQVGFGLRRVRIRFSSQIGDKLKTFFQLETTSFSLMDARIDYKLSDNFDLRAGRFVGAGVRSGALTSHTKIDIVERPEVARVWASRTIGSDYRDYGMAVYGKVSDFKFNLTAHNGSGSTNIKPSNTGTAGILSQGIAMSGMVTYMPKDMKGLEAGAYYGIGNKYINNYNAYSAFLFYEPLPFRFKAEYVGVVNKGGLVDTMVVPTRIDDLKMTGFTILGAYRVQNNIELAARYDVLDPNTNDSFGGKYDRGADLTLGATYSCFPEVWDQSKFTLAYVIQHEEHKSVEVDNDFLYVAWQVLF